jgi:SP family myo-inositol transporter-like MFS transporter 13
MIENVDGAVGMDTIEDTKPGAFVWLCASAAAIGGMLFGCKCKPVILHWSVD